jgi:hypothetical protein
MRWLVVRSLDKTQNNPDVVAPRKKSFYRLRGANWIIRLRDRIPESGLRTPPDLHGFLQTMNAFQDSIAQNVRQCRGEVTQENVEESQSNDDLIAMACEPGTARLLLRVLGASDILSRRFQDVVLTAQLTLAGTEEDSLPPTE